MIIPSIDIMNGKVVQLINGEKKVMEFDSPIKFALKFSIYPMIQVIDLDSAMGTGDNFELIKKICGIANCQVGGGIRTVKKAEELILAGAEKVIIGTKANREFLNELNKVVDKKRIVVAIDTKDGRVATQGWKELTSTTPFSACNDLENYCDSFLYTCIEKEGMMRGSDYDTIIKLKTFTTKKIIVAGGINSIDEIKRYDKIDIDCVVGMAIYSGMDNENNLLPEPYVREGGVEQQESLDINECFIECLDFEKGDGLIPTIVQDQYKNVLMLAYSSKVSLKKALDERRGIYFSRSRNELWRKGEKSGNIQELRMFNVDCDRDTIIFSIKQSGVACHKKTYTCFDENQVFCLEKLYERIKERIGEENEKSYTKKLIENSGLLARKIIEEAGELITAENRDEKIWEAGDLIYFILVLLARDEIKIKDIERELERRDVKKNGIR